MTRRWIEDDDKFVVMFYDVAGPFMGVSDLDRTEEEVIDRVKELKRTGLWDKYTRELEGVEWEFD